jgi:very-short-patch-repair endonuclease
VVDTGQFPELSLREAARVQLNLGPTARDQLRERIERILAADREVLARAGWFDDGWVDRVLDGAPEAFDRAFDRWRELYRSATSQLEEAQSLMLRARTSEQQQEARRQQDEAIRQRNLPRIADFVYEPNILVFCDGPPHDHPEKQSRDQALRRELTVRGWRVLTIRWADDLTAQLGR